VTALIKVQNENNTWFRATVLATRPRFASQQGQEIFLFSETSRPDPGPTQPAIQWAMGDLSQGEMPEVREVIHVRHSCVDGKNRWS
jgi:hypothetical protein